MTKRERAQVVELLRCAADLVINDNNARGNALGIAAPELGLMYMPWLAGICSKDGYWADLIHGRGPVQTVPHDTDPRLVCGTGYEWCLLEAAARVEEGSWP